MKLQNALLLAPFIFLAACSPDSTSENSATPYGTQETFSMTAENFAFSPANLFASKGTELKLEIMNTGTHTFTIDALGINQRLSAGSNTVIFTASTPGTYEYYCAIPGHRDRGMIGTLQIK